MNKLPNHRSYLVDHGRDIIVIFVLIILFSLLLEQTIRFYLFGSDSLSYHKMKSVGSMGYTGYLKGSSIPQVVYEFKPNIDSYFKLVSFKTNSRGLRDREYSVEKPPNTFRVAVIGGSFTVPAGVEIEDAFHTLLEDRLNRESPSLDYEFINFGVSGYRINNKIATLIYKALEYKPDLVLFVLDSSQFTEEDVEKYFPKRRKNYFFQSFTYKLISNNKLFKLNNKKDEEFINEHLRQLNKFDTDLQKLSEISEEYKIPICVVVLDQDYSHLGLGKEIESLVKKNNLFFSSTVPAFKNTNFEDLAIYQIDYHPNAEANQIFAQAIYNDLKEQSLLKKE